MKRSLKTKLISAILSIVLVLQIVPFFSFAVENIEDEVSLYSDITTSTDAESQSIICEDVSKRTEYSKVFLLEDGSYYKITTSYSIHSLVSEEWIDNYDLFLDIDTVDEVKQAVNLLNSEVANTNAGIQTASESTESVSDITITPIYNADTCWATEYEAYEIAASDGAVRITANSIEPYINKNKVINSAYLNFTRDSIDSIVDIETTFYEGISEVSSENIETLRLVDKITVRALDNYSVDITNLFAKWDIGDTENYGIILRAQGNDYLTINNVYFEVYYSEIDMKDENYTYRTLDMGNAGIFQINDYTNTVFYEQKLFKLDSNVLPIYVSRINNGVNPSVTNSAGFGFTWNVESSISVCGNIGVWTTIDYEKKIFVPQENATENGYQVWKEVKDNEIEDKSSVYLYILKSDIESGSVDYSNIFIVQGETKYLFDTLGRLICVEKPGSGNETLSVYITYDENGNLDYIIDENNKKYNFSYATVSELRRSYLKKIEISDSEFTISFSTYKQTVIGTEINPEFIRNLVTFSDGTKITTDIDQLGNVIHVLDAKENSWYFRYVNYSDREKDLGNRIVNLSKLTYVSTNESNGDSYCNTWMLSFYVPNGYCRKIVRTIDFAYEYYENTSTEIIQYDRRHRVITHKDYDGQCVCVEYDENGTVSSYAFNENENNLIANPSFQIGQSSDDYTWSSNEYAELVSTTWEDNEHGNKELKMSLTEETDCVVSQTVTGEFFADNTYVVGAWVKVDGTIPTEDRLIGVAVKEDNGTLVTFDTFDNSLDGEWQYRLQAFKLSSNCNSLTVSLTALNQIGEVRFDEITLFEAIESQTDLLDIVTTSPISYLYNDDGTISSEIMTDGVNSMIKSYVYDENGNVIETNDINGLTEYYEYDSLVKWIGSIKNSDNEIEDATQLIYDSYGVLQSVSKTIYSVSSGDSKTLTTLYGTENGEISSVYHNGFEYLFEYNPDGTLAGIDSAPKEDIDEPLLVEYGYTGSSNIGYIVYKNGYEIDYTYDSKGNITLVECFSVDFENDETISVKNYEYTYNSLGKLISSYDTETGYTIVYSDSGYSIEETRDGETESIELYSKNESENGETVENFRQAYFVESNNTDSDVITTSNITTYADSSTGNTETSSTVVVNKNTDLNEVSTISYDRNSVSDYFNRITNKTTVVDYDKDSQLSYIVVSDTEYEYKRLDVGVTSGLVSSYKNYIYSDIGIPNDVLLKTAAYSRFFEYDHKGNIKFTYLQEESVITPMEYYMYDEANQVTVSIDFSENEVVSYQYNMGGNISSKTYHDFSTTQFDYENRSVVVLGSAIKKEIFTYDTVMRDQLVKVTSLEGEALTNEGSINEENSFLISYDELGNPLNYQGYNVEGEMITGTLNWNGRFLSSFENDTIKIKYQYDLNGYRTQKEVFEKQTYADGSFSWELDYRQSYIWNEGVLTSLICDSGDGEETNINIIYDQEGNPTGFVSSLGVPYFYLKDIDENVIGLVMADGDVFASISYDIWGKPEIVFNSENLIPTEVEMMTLLSSPVIYHGFIYDYEIGLYCNQSRCYSPVFGRYLNPDNPTSLLEYSEDVLDVNLYLFCNNNPINNVDPYASWSRDYLAIGWNAKGFNVEMNEMFASRTFCTIFANQFLEKYGEWNATTGYTYWGMDSLRIASDLFAHYIGKNASAAINKVNAVWGDGWLLNNSQSNTITIRSDDENAWKYQKIWYAASVIKSFAWSEGVYITL